MRRTASAAVERLVRVRARLAEHHLSGLLVTYLPNLRYLTGFSGSSGWLLLGSSRAVFVTDGRYERQAEEELADDAGLELVVLRDGVLGGVAERAAELFAGSRVGFEAPRLSYSDWERLSREGSSLRWVAVSGLVEDLRAVKDPEEIAAIERAAQIAARALAETQWKVKPGVRESEVAGELDYRMRRLGADGPAFETIVASGERTAQPHARTGEREIEEGDLLLCDLGARWRGYCSDLTRSFVVGEPDGRQSETYAAVLAAQRAARGALRAGVEGAAADAAAREALREQGLEEGFTHSTGHGLGLEVHEAPRLRRGSEESLRANMVVTVEPGVYFSGWGGIRLEDDLAVTDSGARSLVEPPADQLPALPTDG